jgi:hypothetical protein
VCRESDRTRTTTALASTGVSNSPRQCERRWEPGGVSQAVPDQKPPRMAAGEAKTLRALLQFQRESLVRKVSGVGDVTARQSPVSSGTSLLWLVTHLARVEISWIVVRFAGQGVMLPDGPDSVDDAINLYRSTWEQVDAVAFTSPLDQLCRQTYGDPPVSLRWVLMHLLEETARHAGHADILRELIDGQVGR